MQVKGDYYFSACKLEDKYLLNKQMNHQMTTDAEKKCKVLKRMGRLYLPLNLKQKFLFRLAKQDVFQISLPQFTPAEVMGQLDYLGACHISRDQEPPSFITLHSFPPPAQIWAVKVGTSVIGLAKGGSLEKQNWFCT